jgi:hypothetical protein
MGDGRNPVRGLRADRYHELHERRGAVQLEPIRRALERNGTGEGAELLTVLDPLVDPIAHLAVQRARQDAAVSERARTVLHSTLEPGNHAPVDQQTNGRGHDVVGTLDPETGRLSWQRALDASAVVGRAGERGEPDVAARCAGRCVVEPGGIEPPTDRVLGSVGVRGGSSGIAPKSFRCSPGCSPCGHRPVAPVWSR